MPGDHIEISDEEAQKFYEAKVKFADYMVIDNKVVLRSIDDTTVSNMPIFIENLSDENDYTVMYMDASWIADQSIEKTSRVRFKWIR